MRENLPQVKTKKKFSIVLPLLAFAGILACLLSWSLSSPAGSAPDDDFHLPSIYCSSFAKSGLCQSGNNDNNRMVSTDLTNIYCFAYNEEINGTCQEAQLEAVRPEMVISDRGNFSGDYPPVFYSFFSLFAQADVTVSVVVMRLLNIIIFAVLGLLTWFGLSKEKRLILPSLWLLTLVPLSISLIPSTNPSSWAIMGIITGWVSLWGLYTQPDSNPWLLGTSFILSSVIAIGSRADSAFFLCIAIFLALWPFSQLRKFGKKILLPLTAFLFAAISFVTSRQSLSAYAGLGVAEGASNERTPISILGFNLTELPGLYAGIFGTWKIGWLDTEMPAIVWVPTLFVVSVVLFSQGKFLSKSDGFRLIVTFLLLVIIPLYLLQVSSSHVGENVQPRYLIPLFGLFVGTILVQMNLWRGMLNNIQLFILCFCISIAQAFALYTNFARYISGLGPGLSWSLDISAETGWWWDTPVSPMTLWAIGSLGFCIFTYWVISQWSKEKNEVCSESATLQVKTS